MIPDWVMDLETFTELLYRWTQGEDKSHLRYFFEGTILNAAIVTGQEVFWLVMERGLVDDGVMDLLVKKGLRVEGLININLHNELLEKIGDVKDAAKANPFNNGNSEGS